MARRASVFSKNHISDLRKALLQRLAVTSLKEINCSTLAQQIKQTMHVSLSVQTLRRFSGQVQDTASVPSAFTLNAIAEFCGYNDFTSFTKLLNDEKGFTPASLEHERELYLNVYRVEIKNEQDENYHNAVRFIAERIVNNIILYNSLVATLAKLPAGQIFFFERFPYIDGLGVGYDRGYKLYLQYKKDRQAQIFGYSILLLKAFLCDNKTEMELYYKEMEKHEIRITDHAFVIGRKIGSELLYHFHNNNKDAFYMAVNAAMEMSKKINEEKYGIWVFPHYKYMISDYLLLVHRYDLVYELLHPITKQKREEIIVQNGYYEALMVMYWRSYFEVNNKWKDFEKVEHKIPAQFNFTFQKYFSIHRKLIEFKALQAKKVTAKKVEVQLINLIEQTGFTFFKGVL